MVKENSVILNEIDKARLKLSIEHYTKYFIGKRTCEISKEEALKVISLAVREFAMDRMYQTIARYNKVNSKRVYYLSIEYLIGRSLENNLHNLGLFNICLLYTSDAGRLVPGFDGLARHSRFRLRHQL